VPVRSRTVSSVVRSKLIVGSSAVTFLSFGLPASMFGVLWPDVRERFGQSLGTLGLVLLVYGVTRMTTSGIGTAATSRFGIGRCFVAGIVGWPVVVIDAPKPRAGRRSSRLARPNSRSRSSLPNDRGQRTMATSPHVQGTRRRKRTWGARQRPVIEQRGDDAFIGSQWCGRELR
jgi:hypothetical protein